MTLEAKHFPGELATVEELFALAELYREAAQLLQQQGCRGRPLTRAPFRFAAIHALELYLNVFLLRHGHSPARLRGLQHDLGARTTLAAEAGLKLRERTAAHLATLSQSREYLVTRYGPERVATASPPNRLTATLDEVAAKVAVALTRPPAPRARPGAAGAERALGVGLPAA
ncbi:hypothetical protein NK718_04435 [Alsobacter sp. SYSU M60028]|uniref:HEPN domain-containing protein n=1 Tax=Alsobacter ponti TaxID=2962936 RepID=A0ABT1L8C4_9HYPH|nr:hypothetical protein [Alsobacter ponti]MCP8937752.1 hypothetical protein [Alsobacter ponti]